MLAPTSDSHIRAVTNCNPTGAADFQAVGNGGWAGSISNDAMAAALREGYATASTDTGHKSKETPGGSFAAGHPEKLIDYGYRAVHEMTVAAKKLIEDCCRKAAWRSHCILECFCSNGGRKELMEAQRYPADFDGIVAGAPAANWTGRAIGSLWVAQIVHKDEASYIPPQKYALLHEAALRACDGLDGVVDGVIEDPRRCKVDPGALLCQGADSATCLTAAAWTQPLGDRRGALAGFIPGLAPEASWLGPLLRRS